MTEEHASTLAVEPWQDPERTVAERVDHLLSHMTLREKTSQLVGLWVGADATNGGVAPYQADLTRAPLGWDAVIADGLGQLTRPFGTTPVEPATGARGLANSQQEIVRANRWRIPALVHEECLAGFAAWKATAYPVPLSWGASFDPDLVAEMARRIGGSMRSVGIHQGLAPVLDVTRDYRWGRTEETIGEDPYLVGTVGTAYVSGLQDSGVIATLKHFAGYSASRAGRNLAPVSMGRNELADVVLPPFEMAVIEGGPGSVMHSYTEIDGVPSAADRDLLTGLLRETWGFDGTVVADYFGVKFLIMLHGVAGTEAAAARLALNAGVDVELPTIHCYGEPLVEAVERGEIDEALVDVAVRRVLIQKAEIGLLDAEFDPEVPDAEAVDLDDDLSKDVALRLAREGVVLVANDGTLPLARPGRVAVVGPRADDSLAMLGCYSFPAHVGVRHPETDIGIDIPTVLSELHRELGEITFAPGCTVTGESTAGFAAAVEAAREADVAVVAVGDQAGLFGRGTSGEGCDVTDLKLPGVQHELVEAILDTGTPVVLLLVTGRPYAVGPLAERAAATVQAFFPGQLGGRAIAEILTGRTNPSGRLPVSIPRHAGGQPGTYLTQRLGTKTDVSNIDPTPVYSFGHGLSYTTFEWDAATADVTDWAVDGEVSVEVTVRNTGDRAGTEVVQLYLHDPVASVTRPAVRLVGYARVPLEAGEAKRVRFTVPADATSFTLRDGRRIIEPGDVELRLGRSAADIEAALPLRIVGGVRVVDHTRRLSVPVSVGPAR
ncbi:glycoside hydrolase family 3 N-terminal domain-containing protein [Georgenia halophila]|uniref:Glycoside hydrolase family 3 N-terminal domain-containing protein n=1 Tax=Georgenia halophila TaxID=620889 RepID=A0ABP8LIX8_9MICO